ncbi:MAG: ribonuclease H-like domain-containing protein [Eubacteriales bacterium]|nr:ribonuclease H-like domain-containing protein [Eubacteriales bacterium]
MLVKKMPIFQGFPDFETVRRLAGPRVKTEDFQPVFYDIETTGLSRNSTFLYLIGAVIFEEDHWMLYQWFGENQEDEKPLLEHFCAFLKACTCTIQYNGDRFDQPYIETRCSLHGLDTPFKGKSSLDLYLSLKPVKGLLKLTQMKQPDMECLLGMGNRTHCDGKECIRLYRTYIKNKAAKACETVMGHNQEDLQGLGRILTLLGFLCLYEGNYTPVKADFNGTHLIMKVTLPYKLPVPFSNGSKGFYITGKDKEASLSLEAADGRVKQYYKNYKDYDYLPAEDTAVPKALSAYMDKSLRTPAKPETCYTWFDCTGKFLENSSQQLQYLTHSLPYLLSALK